MRRSRSGVTPHDRVLADQRREGADQSREVAEEMRASAEDARRAAGEVKTLDTVAGRTARSAL
jgi:hypothetical protein